MENLIIECAESIGFDAAATLPLHTKDSVDSFDVWLAESRHGGMKYMENHRALRPSAAALEPWVQSAIVCLTHYPAPIDLLPGGLRIARYAHGDDYHDVLRARLEALVSQVESLAGQKVRIAVDTAPILERQLAEFAGLGWIGKNAMLINTSIGSFTFISEILTDLPLNRSQDSAPDRCGTCSACIDECPTAAIVSPQVIDARRCIAYWTIEHRGTIPREMRPLIGNFWFGCDLCQDVCPWNRKRESSTENEFSTRAHYLGKRPVDILTMQIEHYTEWFRGSAIKRATYFGLLRNAAIVLGNTRTGLQTLIEQLNSQPNSMVREHIAWAIGEFDLPAAKMALRAHTDPDPSVAAEVRAALKS